ncbi:PKD domain-containing protein [Lentzea alba]|uniref:PKD domain-containing protein n=1 Tax=Lentzea alba TaxID=2714351 RepID=UPI0039BF2694
MPTSRSVLRVAGLAVALLTAGALTPAVAHAAPPSNDDFANATVVTSLPFSVEQDTTEATAELDDPNRDCLNNEVKNTVWFRYTPTEDGLLRFSTRQSDRDLPVTVYTGEHGDLKRANPATGDCLPYRTRKVALRVTAGTTYHLMVTGQYGSIGGTLRFSMDHGTAPANDNFADAEPVTSLPFVGSYPDFSTASIETDEPSGCTASPFAGTVWYRYTPSQTQFVLTELNANANSGPSLSVHEGTSLADLRQLSCAKVGPDKGRVVELTAGRTYYLQFADNPFYDAQAVPKMTEAPQLRVGIGGSYGTRTTYDPIPFALGVSDDYESPVTTDWDFGDGTKVLATQVKEQPHRYTKDGRYTVTVHSKSADGRSASASVEVVVDTHNVEVTKLVVPATAQAGETKPVNLAVKSHHGAERTLIQLYEVNPNGTWSAIGERWVDLPAQPAMSTFIQFHYTFTQEDVAQGTTKFLAIAQLQNGLTDARPDNNRKSAQTTISAPFAQRAS